ncbi:MAG: hypothetical protein COA38_08190 [Fluviicola sp.]|nr:MAG: hypothetical protein COA38_08190 [Fluviicola sp.]
MSHSRKPFNKQDMKFNNKKLEKTSIIINYTIAVLLCGFLILLTGIVIDDVDEWKEGPSVEQFQNSNLLKEKKLTIKAIDIKIDSKRENKSSVQQTIKVAKNNYVNAKKSFDNWLKARKTVGSPKEDVEVRKRAVKLDNYYSTQQEWEKELSEISDSIKLLNEQRDEVSKLIAKEKSRAYEEQRKAIRQYDVKVFFIRLLIIVPILLLGIFFMLKFRKHKYWPLFFGFVLFSFYAFFFGLVPYLPSYGGYIRYTVGIILIILFGVYAINKIKSFVEQKKNELKISTEERSKKVLTETAEKALDDHMCPSCGKDFIVKDWDKSLGKKGKETILGKVTDFCRFCGLQLFKKCKSCNTKNFAHLPFCCNCGDKLINEEITCSDEMHE